MSHEPYDKVAKAISIEVIEQMGTAETEQEVTAPTQYIDTAYSCIAGTEPESWTGWLGRMIAQGSGMLEHFSRAPRLEDVDECLRKLMNYEHKQVLKARREQRPRPARPLLWLICAGRPVKALREHKAEPMVGWPPGFWSASGFPRMRFVVLPDLPEERSTLLLRLKGRGRTLNQALSEVLALPQGSRIRALMGKLLIALPRQFFQDVDTEELSMQAREAYAQLMALYEEVEQEISARERKAGIRQGRKEGRQEGRQEGERAILTRQLTRRFGTLPAEIAKRIEHAHTAQLERWSVRVLDARSLDEVFD